MRQGFSFLLVTYVAYIALFSLAPYTFELDGLTSVSEQFQRRFEWFSGGSQFAAWDVWTNTLFYLPYGSLFVASPWLAAVPLRRRVLLAGLTSCAVSLGLEAAQVFLPRQPSINDVVCNTAGAVIGALIGSRRQYDHRVLPQSAFIWRTCTTATMGMAVYPLLVVAILAVPLPLATDLEVWGAEVELSLGAVDGAQTPWRGTIYMVSVYRRALNAEEVLTNFLAGPDSPSAAPRIREGLVLFHRFSAKGGDVASGLVPVYLSILDPARARWVTPHGLALDGTSLTMWASPPMRPTGWRFLSHEEFSVEVWIAPAEPAQIESVRIVSYSRAPPRERLTFSQYRREFLLRLNPETHRSPRLSHGFLLDPDREAPQHVLITHRDGIETRYVNAAEAQKQIVRVNRACVDVLLDIIGEHFRWPVYSLLMFALGVSTYLWHACRSRSAPPKWLPLVSVSALLLFLVLVRLFTLKGIEPLLIIVGGFSILASLMVAPYFAQYIENK